MQSYTIVKDINMKFLAIVSPPSIYQKRSNYLSLTLVVTFSHLSEALMTQKKWCRAHAAGFKPLKAAKNAKNKKGALLGYSWQEHPLFWTRKLRFWNRVSEFSGGTHIRKNSKTYPKSNFGWYGPPTHGCKYSYWLSQKHPEYHHFWHHISSPGERRPQ